MGILYNIGDVWTVCALPREEQERSNAGENNSQAYGTKQATFCEYGRMERIPVNRLLKAWLSSK